VRREIFEPLGLRRCRVGGFRLDEAGESRNRTAAAGGQRALQCGRGMGGADRLRGRRRHPCSLDDMLAWARNWLAPTPRKLAWLSPGATRTDVEARTPMPISARRRAWDRTHSLAYAFGFRLADMDGEWTVSHTGSLNRHVLGDAAAPGPAQRLRADDQRRRRYRAHGADRGAAGRAAAAGAGRSVAALADELAREAAMPAAARTPDTSSRRPATPGSMAPWLGVWRDPWLGTVSICADGDRCAGSRRSRRGCAAR
jgi:hypothetical protein